MSPAGFLTAIDSSVRHELNPKDKSGQPVFISVDQVNRVLNFLRKEISAKSKDGVEEGPYRTLFRYLHPLAIAEIDRYSSGSELIAIKMMKMHKASFENEQKILQIAERLVSGYPAHTFPILYPEANQIGLPVERDARHSGKSKYSLWRLVELGLDGIFSFSIVPIRAAVILGVGAVGFTMAYAAFAVYAKLALDRSPQGFTALIVVITFVSGVLLFFLGIIGEYIGRIYQEVKGRPLYVVDRVLGGQEE